MATDARFYKSIAPYVGEGKSYLSPGDNLRLQSYQAYYDIYWSDIDSLSILRRGDAQPIILPSGRIMCNTINRYTAPRFTAVPDPSLGTAQEQELMKVWFASLFKRERFNSRFLANKLSGIQKGDALWFITADDTKEEGSRISVRPLDPATYFTIDDPYDEDRILGCQIIEELLVGETAAIKVQTYLKPGAVAPEGDNSGSEFISWQVDTWEMEGYPAEKKGVSGPGAEKIPIEAVEGITHLPVYHIRNTEEAGNHWGSSEMRGLETMIAGINQSVSDTDLALAMQGLGMYWTDGGPPVDANQNPTNWQLGPGEVVEVGDGKKFNRVQGITSVDPQQDHLKLMEDRMARTNGASDVAQGIVDVSVAESGIALQLRMAPIIEAGGLKETWLMDTMDQMLHDLREWAAVYEGQNFDTTEMISLVGEKLPENKQEIFDNYLAMYQASPPIISGATFRKKAAEIGYDIPEDDLTTIVAEQVQLAAAADEYAGRTGDGGEGEPDVTDNESADVEA